MDFLTAASVLIPALSGIDMAVLGPGGSAPEDLERRFCFMPAAQPLLTAEGLRGFFARRRRDRIYSAADLLGARCVIFALGEDWIFLGPFAASPWREGDARRALTRVRARDGALLLFKSWYCALPMVPEELVLRAAALILANTAGGQPRTVERLDLGLEGLGDVPPRIAESCEELQVVLERYRLEDRLMEEVRAGDAQAAVDTYSRLIASARGLRFMSDSLRDQIAGAAMMRTLVRRGALNAGLAPVLVDAMSQEFAQKMHAAADAGTLADLTRRYIAAFCAAVREHQRRGGSPSVRRAVQYIQVHLSEQIDPEGLTAASGVSRRQLARLFREDTGLTVKQYITKARCECAAELLENSRLHVHDIAAYVGFDDANFFARIFKLTMGVSPKKYREMKKV